MNKQHSQWLELFVSWQVDQKISVKCLSKEIHRELISYFWKEDHPLFHCPRGIADGSTHILPMEALKTLRKERHKYRFGRVLPGIKPKRS